MNKYATPPTGFLLYHSFIQQTRIKHLLYAVHAGGAGDTVGSSFKIPVFRELWALLHTVSHFQTTPQSGLLLSSLVKLTSL